MRSGWREALGRGRFAAVIVATIGLALGGCGTIQAKRWEQRAGIVLTAQRASEHFDLHFRPEASAASSWEATAAFAEGELARMCEMIAVSNTARFRLYLFDDLAGLRRTLAANDPSLQALGGMAWRGAVYAVAADRGGLAHEIGHLVVERHWAESTVTWKAEGIASVLGGTHGNAPPHGHAKYYRLLGKPLHVENFPRTMPEMLAWPQRTGMWPYDVTASWIQYLLEAHGPEKLARYYRGESEGACFGMGVSQLEMGWWAMLDRRELTDAEQGVILARIRGPWIAQVRVGEATTLAVTGGRTNVSFAWSKAGMDLAETTDKLALRNAAAADAGRYRCKIRSEAGEVLQEVEFEVIVRPREDAGE